MELEEFVRRVLLDNAIKYEGETRAQAAIGAVMREFPEMRDDKKTVMETADRVAAEINALTLEEQRTLLGNMGGSGAPEKEERDPFDLDHDKPVLRFEPSPSGPMHIGHAYPLGLNHILAARNEGALILRIADTNPDNIYEGAYELLPADARWYTHEGIAQTYIQSDRLPLYYQYAEKMLQEGWAYICTCPAETFREYINDKKACPCRALTPPENMERWELMLSEYEPGDAVMRIKTDVAHPNPAMRDWPAMRINTGKHPRQGERYRVWPLMNFSVSVDDMDMGMTHVLRAKDHADNAKRQEYMYHYFGKPVPETMFVGKINFTDLKLSTSETRKKIDEGRFTGWDDIRLPFLPALRRRGYQPEAFLRLAMENGISPVDKTVSGEEYFTNLDAFNREIIDPLADRAFFVADAQQITINGAPTFEIEKDLHPDKRKGGRTLKVGPEMLVQKDDLMDPEGVLFRFIDGYNFQFKDGSWHYVDTDYNTFRSAKKKRIIHFLAVDQPHEKVRVHLPDGTWKEGVAEPHVLGEEGDVLQFERFGFVRLDNVERREFWFAHR